MSNADVLSILGNTDIYLVDQIMKGRYNTGDVVLDAGCGRGRNLHWFLRNGFAIYGVDSDPDAIQDLLEREPLFPRDRFHISTVQEMPFDNQFFDSIISSAVLHFAESKVHFFGMMDEMCRVLKKGGSLFIRMTSDIGIENRVKALGNDSYLLPDGSTRFLLTRPLLQQVINRYSLGFLEDFKTVNVADVRCMSTLVLQKLA